MRLVCGGAVLSIVLLLAACSEQQGTPHVKFNSIDVTGVDYGNDFALTGHDGKARALVDFKGKALVFFFGYTHCPDYCPSALAGYKRTLELLGTDAARVQVVFFTLDPVRDTAQALRDYVTGFDPGFLGLYADEAGTKQTAQRFRIFFEKQPADRDTGAYNVDHTVGAYIFDPQGRLRLFAASDITPEKLASDLQQLLK